MGSAYLEKRLMAGVAPIRNVSVVTGAIGGTISFKWIRISKWLPNFLAAAWSSPNRSRKRNLYGNVKYSVKRRYPAKERFVYGNRDSLSANPTCFIAWSAGMMTGSGNFA